MPVMLYLSTVFLIYIYIWYKWMLLLSVLNFWSVILHSSTLITYIFSLILSTRDENDCSGQNDVFKWLVLGSFTLRLDRKRNREKHFTFCVLFGFMWWAYFAFQICQLVLLLCCGGPGKRVDHPGNHPQICGAAGQIFWQCECQNI